MLQYKKNLNLKSKTRRYLLKHNYSKKARKVKISLI